MARTACSACRVTIPKRAARGAGSARRSVRRRRSKPGTTASSSTTDDASFASSAPKHAQRARWSLPTTGPSASVTGLILCGRMMRADRRLHNHPRRGAFHRSLHIRHVDAGSCNGCESELQGLNNPFYNLHRFGIFFTPSPRFADLLLVTGPVTHANARAPQGGLRRPCPNRAG